MQSALRAGNSDTKALILISLCTATAFIHTGSDFYLAGCDNIQQTKQRTQTHFLCTLICKMTKILEESIKTLQKCETLSPPYGLVNFIDD